MTNNLRKILFFLIAIFSYKIMFAMEQDSWQILDLDPSSKYTQQEIVFAYHSKLYQDSISENKLGKEKIKQACSDILDKNCENPNDPGFKDTVPQLEQDNLQQLPRKNSEENNQNTNNIFSDNLPKIVTKRANANHATVSRNDTDNLMTNYAYRSALKASHKVAQEADNYNIQLRDLRFKGGICNGIEEFLHSNYGLNLAQYIEQEYGTNKNFQFNNEKFLKNYRKEHLATLRSEFLSKLKILSSVNIVNYLYELARIINIGSKNKKSIKLFAETGKISNIFSIAKLPLYIANKIAAKYFPNSEIKIDDKALGLAKESSILSSLAAFNFYTKDSELARNAEDIANYNKRNNTNFTKNKIMQTAWLTFNKILPFAGYIYSRIKNDNVKFDEVFTEKNNYGSSFYSLIKLKAIADMSEIIRKHFRYKAELGK